MFDGGLNFYSYSVNDPINFHDVNGLAPDWAGPVGRFATYIGGVVAGAGVAVGLPAVIIGGGVIVAVGGGLQIWDAFTSLDEDFDAVMEGDDVKDLKENRDKIEKFLNEQVENSCP